MFPELPDLSTLSDEDLANLESEYTATFNEQSSDPSKLSAEDVAALTAGVNAIDQLRAEQAARAEASQQLAEQVAQLSAQVNGEGGEGEGEGGQDGDNEAEGNEAGTDTNEDEGNEGEGQTQGGEASGASGEQLQASGDRPAQAGGAVANMRRTTPARTRPRQDDRSANAPYITASGEVPGVAAGGRVKDMRQVAELMTERHRTIGEGSGDRANVVRFNRNMPTERQMPEGLASLREIKDFLAQFKQGDRNSIRAAGGLCAPVDNYYEIQVLAEAMRPVRDGLANLQAPRGGLKYMPPPSMASITSGVGVVTAAQDASNTTKSTFTVTCPNPVEVDIAAIYNQLRFGNFGARAWPEQVEAYDNLSLAKQASLAEQFLLDQISAWCSTNNTQVTVAGNVGAGRELFARLSQAAAGFRSRNRMRPDALLSVMLPAWTLDLVSADFARTFTDETGLISMTQNDIEALFGDRNLDPIFYVDSKTGGGQVFGAVSSGYAGTGRTITDAATTSGSTALTSATGAFTANDVGVTAVGAGIPAGTTIASVTNGTTAVLSANATATATGVSLRLAGFVLAEFPTTVDVFLFPTGSLLHLDGGTLDLGIVRDTTTNTNNQFVTFTEEFENVAVIGVEVDELIFTLNPDGSYAAARTLSVPIKN